MHTVKNKKKLIIFLSILLFILIVAAVYLYVYILFDQVQHNPVTDADGRKLTSREDFGISDTAPSRKDTGVTNILLFGVDRRSPNQASRSDTIMIATMDNKNKTLKITSIMRDMYVSIPERQDNRINSAYIFGGPALAIQTVNTNFNLDIQDYVTVDFFAFESIIDTIGGIDIVVKDYEVKELNRAIDYVNTIDKNSPKSPHITSSGNQTLNGRQALAYARIRNVGNSDFERTDRQRTVMNEMFKKAKTVELTKIPELISTVLPQVETSLSKTEILDLARIALGFNISNLEEFRLPVDGVFERQKIRGMDVLVPDIQENNRLLHEFIYGENPD